MILVLSYAVILIIVFAAIIVVLRKIFLSDTESAVSRLRQMDVESDGRQQELKNMQKDIDKQREIAINDTNEEIKALKEKTKQEVDKMRQEMLEKAREESDSIISAARSRTESVRQEIQQELQSQTIDYAGELITSALNKRILKDLDVSLVSELLQQLKSLDKSQLITDNKEVEITFAELPDEERKRQIKQDLTEVLGYEIQIKEKQDTSLLAGIILHLGSFVIDGSLVNYLREAREKTKRKIEK